MLSDRTCEKYKEWKKEQERLKGTKKKRKKCKKVTTDCIEEEKKTKTIVKIRYRKCEKKGRAKERGERGIFKAKPVSSIDLLLERIKPSLEARYQFFNPRHMNCFVETLPEIDLVTLKETIQRERGRPERKDLKRRKKKKRKKKISKGEEEESGDRKEETMSQENDSAGKAEEETSDETKEETTADGEISVERKEDDLSTSEKRRKVIRRRDKFWCKKYQKKIEPESDSEDDECESICSFDSEICLKGLALTVEDKKKIKENRRRVQTSSGGVN